MEEKILQAINIHKMLHKVPDEDIAAQLGMTRRNLVYLRTRVEKGIGLNANQLGKLKAYCQANKISIE